MSRIVIESRADGGIERMIWFLSNVFLCFAFALLAGLLDQGKMIGIYLVSARKIYFEIYFFWKI